MKQARSQRSGRNPDVPTDAELAERAREVREAAQLAEQLPAWQLQSPGTPLECLLDSKVIAKWVAGQWQVKEVAHRSTVQALQNLLQMAWRLGILRVRAAACRWTRHVYREESKLADALATRGLLKAAVAFAEECDWSQVAAAKLRRDGGVRDAGSGAGWVLWVAWKHDQPPASASGAGSPERRAEKRSRTPRLEARRQ